METHNFNRINYNQPSNASSKIWYLLSFMILLCTFGGIYYFVFLNKTSKNLTEKISPVAENIVPVKKEEPKDVQNPLNGVLYTKSQSDAWINLRPLGVMINNHVDARPQLGLEQADLVYEVIAEGGITRYLAVFLSENPIKVGPVRSVRHYYLYIIKELGDALIMHIGWSPQAEETITTWNVASLFKAGGQFTRDFSRDVATEHTAYVNLEELRALAEKKSWNLLGASKKVEAWSFKEDAEKLYSIESIKTANDLQIDFWFAGDYSAVWKYDSNSNEYQRYLGFDKNNSPLPHIDDKSKKQLTAKTLIVQFAEELKIAGDDKNRLDYELVGSGTAWVFIDGKVVESTWSKKDKDSRTLFYDGDGKLLKFNRGKIWISIVPDRNKNQVQYK